MLFFAIEHDFYIDRSVCDHCLQDVSDTIVLQREGITFDLFYN